MSARYIVGDVLEQLRKLPDASVDLVFSSPPFLALRSYLPPDHPDKAKEIGSESTPGEFLDALLDVTEECARVLTPHGSLCFELGDTYGGHDNRGSGCDDGRHDAKTRTVQTGPGYPLDKSLCLVPESYRWALAYGRNPFTGRQTDPWRVRNVIRWHRPNPPVGALGDKFRPATSDVVVACKSRTRYFDLDAVRGDPADVKDQRHRNTNGPKQDADPAEVLTASYHQRVPSHPNGAPPLDTWTIPTAPYAGSHYATFPPALVIKPVLAMCPERVCTVCGEPSRRIVGDPEYVASERGVAVTSADPDRPGRFGGMTYQGSVVRSAPTLGWTDCGHDSWRRGVVLDPFAGSGTVLAVASGHGRDAIGIDLDERNADLALERVGMFLTVERPEFAHITSNTQVKEDK